MSQKKPLISRKGTKRYDPTRWRKKRNVKGVVKKPRISRKGTKRYDQASWRKKNVYENGVAKKTTHIEKRYETLRPSKVTQKKFI